MRYIISGVDSGIISALVRYNFCAKAAGIRAFPGTISAWITCPVHRVIPCYTAREVRYNFSAGGTISALIRKEQLLDRLLLGQFLDVWRARHADSELPVGLLVFDVFFVDGRRSQNLVQCHEVDKGGRIPVIATFEFAERRDFIVR